jgi:hypothetical protein
MPIAIHSVKDRSDGKAMLKCIQMTMIMNSEDSVNRFISTKPFPLIAAESQNVIVNSESPGIHPKLCP